MNPQKGPSFVITACINALIFGGSFFYHPEPSPADMVFETPTLIASATFIVSVFMTLLGSIRILRAKEKDLKTRYILYTLIGAIPFASGLVIGFYNS